MHYLAQIDPQANRLLFILTSFRDVVVRQNAAASQNLNPVVKAQLPPQHPSRSLPYENVDPIGDLFMDGTSAGMPPTTPATAGPPEPIRRNGSNPNITPPRHLNSQDRHPSSPSNAMNGDTSNDYHQDMTMSGSPTSVAGRQNSLDTFLDLARVSSNNGEPTDSFGEEIDFESLWQWPTNGPDLTPGAASSSEYFSESPESSFPITPRALGAEAGFAVI